MERLQKVMASRGVASRRACEDLILAGRVRVNGKIVREMGTKVSQGDIIAVDGRELSAKKDPPVYVILNKPKGFVTTVKDPEGRSTVMDLVSKLGARVYPVGRLDYDTEGLLILTNDGDMSYALTHPSHGVDKTYVARVWGTPTREALKKLRSGVELEDGLTAPARVKLLRRGRQSEIELIIHQGKKRQVRRMLEAVGHPVIGLRRTRFGPLSVQGIPPGKYRHLTLDEIRALKSIKTAVISKRKPGGAGNVRQAYKRNGPGLHRER